MDTMDTLPILSVSLRCWQTWVPCSYPSLPKKRMISALPADVRSESFASLRLIHVVVQGADGAGANLTHSLWLNMALAPVFAICPGHPLLSKARPNKCQSPHGISFFLEHGFGIYDSPSCNVWLGVAPSFRQPGASRCARCPPGQEATPANIFVSTVRGRGQGAVDALLHHIRP